MNIIKRNYALLVIIVIAAFALRIYKLADHGIWFDEKASLRNALGIPVVKIDDTLLSHFDQLRYNWRELNFSNGEIFTSSDFWKYNTPINVHRAIFISNGSIIYSFALHYWIKIFGPTDFWLRFLSLVFGCLTVILTFYIANLLFKSYKMALIASALIALHPLFVASSQFTRSHSMAGFFTLLATYILFRIIQYNKNKLSKEEENEYRICSIGTRRAGTRYLSIAYTLAVAISLLSHYFTAYVFIGHFLIMLLLVKDRGVWINYMLANVVVIVIFGLWLYKGGGRGSLEVADMVNTNCGELAHNWKKGDNTYFMPATFSNILTCWVQVLLPLFGNYCQSLGFRIRELAVLLFIPLLFLFIGFYRNTDIEKKKLLSALIILSIMFPVFATLVAMRYYHLIVFMPTYSVYAAPFAIMLFVYGINKIVNLNKSWKWVLYTLVSIQIILNLLSLIPVYFDYSFNRGTNPYIVLSNTIKSAYQAKDIIIYPTWEDAMFTNIYLKENTNILQMIDTTLHDKVYIFNTDGAGKRKIFDFQNGKLRY